MTGLTENAGQPDAMAIFWKGLPPLEGYPCPAAHKPPRDWPNWQRTEQAQASSVDVHTAPSLDILPTSQEWTAQPFVDTRRP